MHNESLLTVFHVLHMLQPSLLLTTKSYLRFSSHEMLYFLDDATMLNMQHHNNVSKLWLTLNIPQNGSSDIQPP